MSGPGCELLRSSDVAERYLGVGAAVGGINESGDEQLAAKLRQLMND